MQHKILLLLCFCRLSGASDSGIVAGRPSKPHSRPYMVSLQLYDSGHHCGGALVRGDFVLTSAHCKHQEALTVVLGAHNIRKTERNQQRIQVAKYHVHPKYGIDNNLDYDVMLLELEKNATLNRFVKPIGLPKKNGEIPANTKCIVAGWGKAFPNADASDVLMETTVNVKSLRECKTTWDTHFNSDQMICTLSSGKKGGFCEGDSGGPVVCGKKAQAIATFTEEHDCDNPNVPQVSMKIPYFVSWIQKVMNKRA